jgi:heme/copper-type cytochrome/quinol oxidase subunit 2
MESQGKKTMLAAVGVVVLALAVWYGVGGNLTGSPVGPSTADAPLNTTMNDLNARLLFSPIVPVSAAPTPPEQVFFASEQSESVRLNSFTIVADKGSFSPSTIVVGDGENVQINFTAVDRDYDLAVAQPIGAYVRAKAGETQVFGFSTDQVGTYQFMCFQYCPEGRTIEGSIVVLKKNS